MKAYLAMVLGMGMVASTWTVGAVELPAAEPAKEVKKMAVPKAVYVCPACDAMAMTAGKCEKCDKELVAMHLLGTKDGKAMLCDCAVDCACDAAGVKDDKCACGKTVKTVSCKGMYCCPMGCKSTSDKPGKCACGKDLKKTE